MTVAAAIDRLEGRALSYRAAGRLLFDNADLSLAGGEVHALLGPNGVGKSTLLRLLCGELSTTSGEVKLGGQLLSSWRAADRARRLAVLPQLDTLRFGFTVEQVVALGRLPWRDASRAAIDRAMRRAGIEALAARRYPDLSGGERARVQFARVCAQIDGASEGVFLLLDEPVARLDPAQQHRLLGELRRLAAEGVGVLIVLHEPNHALHYADRCTLLAEGRVQVSGLTQDVLTPQQLECLYGVPFAAGGTAAACWIGVNGPWSG